MSKFYGKIGYSITKELTPGEWVDTPIERSYFGDITRNYSRYETTGGVNNNITLNNTISILADPFAYENFQHMRYVSYLNVKWKINSAEIQYPRIILSIGGKYNE